MKGKDAITWLQKVERTLDDNTPIYDEREYTVQFLIQHSTTKPFEQKENKPTGQQPMFIKRNYNNKPVLKFKLPSRGAEKESISIDLYNTDGEFIETTDNVKLANKFAKERNSVITSSYISTKAKKTTRLFNEGMTLSVLYKKWILLLTDKYERNNNG